MKNSALPFLFIAFLFVFGACEQEAVKPPVSIQPEMTSLANLDEVIIFHVSQSDLLTGERTGVLVDKYGYVKKYFLNENEASQLPIYGEWTEEDIDFLYNRSKTVVMELVDSEVIDFYKKIKTARQGTLSAVVEDESQTMVKTFHAFQADHMYQSENDNGSCGEGCDVGSNTYLVYEAHLLSMTGAQEQTNDHADAEAIINWLEGFVVEAGL